MLNFAWRDYGNRVGAWYLLDAFDALKLPMAALLNSSMYDYAPALVAAHRARGDEIVGHGRTNAERQGTLDEAAEKALIAEATQRLTKGEGRPPEGWLGPWISHSPATPDLLAEAGYRYLLDWCMDDQPIWFDCRGGRKIMAVPYPQELNDIPAIVARKENGSDFADMIVDQFDEMLELSHKRPLVMGVAPARLYRRPAAPAAPSQARARPYRGQGATTSGSPPRARSPAIAPPCRPVWCLKQFSCSSPPIGGEDG